MGEGVILAAYLLIVAISYFVLAWLLRRWVDPDGSFRELPLPWFFSWPILFISIFAPLFVVWVLRGLIRLFL